MKLTDLDKLQSAKRALKENFSMDFNIDNLDKSQTRTMLNRVRGLIQEAKRSTNFYSAQENPSYLKLVFMEQALAQHMKYAKSPRIIYENEEVQKSQVILAAQDMVDTIQGMFEDVNDMLVKELPSLVDSIESEIGANESQSYSEAAGEALNGLNSTLQETMNGLKSALGILTGQGPAENFGGDDMSDDDMGADMDVDMDVDMDIDDAGGDDMDLPPIPDEEEMMGQVGRAKR